MCCFSHVCSHRLKYQKQIIVCVCVCVNVNDSALMYIMALIYYIYVYRKIKSGLMINGGEIPQALMSECLFHVRIMCVVLISLYSCVLESF